MCIVKIMQVVSTFQNTEESSVRMTNVMFIIPMKNDFVGCHSSLSTCQCQLSDTTFSHVTGLIPNLGLEGSNLG